MTADTRPLTTADFDYELPPSLIASRPTERRDASRLLVLDRRTGRIQDRVFTDLAERIPAGDALVINDSRVFPARLRGRKPTGARAEVLLLRPVAERGDREWEALVRPGGKLKPGRVVEVADGLSIEILDSAPGGGRRVRLVGAGEPWRLIEKHGEIPLPPYIERESDDEDRDRYQTVYARQRGSVAAPTAGLHFTPGMLEALKASGVRLVRITLHVGVGTFRPVEVDRPEDHELHSERYELDQVAADDLNAVREAGGRIWAVGTTSARTLETVIGEHGRFLADEGWTDLFIRPSFEFRAVDRLLTNFHLPKSSLLMLVSAFGGLDHVMAAYEHAARGGYRFYSYGDAMLVT